MEEFNNHTERPFEETTYQKKTNITLVNELSAPLTWSQEKIDEIMDFSHNVINEALSKKMEMFVLGEDNRYQKITNHDISDELLKMLRTAQENIQRDLQNTIEAIQNKLAVDVDIFVPIILEDNNPNTSIISEDKNDTESIQIADYNNVSEVQHEEFVDVEEGNDSPLEVVDSNNISENIYQNMDWDKSKTQDAIRNTIEIINEKLAELDEIAIKDFGVFSTNKENEYISRNEETNEAYLNPPRIHPVFKKS